MPEVIITRKQVIVVDTVAINTYGGLAFTDKEGGKYKIGKARIGHFEKIIQPDVAVQLIWADNPHKTGTEYIYSAEPVTGKLPSPVKVETVPVPGVEIPPQPPKPPPQKDDMSKEDWAERERITRKSTERQTALTDATRVAVAKISAGDKDITTEKILASAKVFETYLETGEAVLPKSGLIDAAKKLGAVETK